MLKAALKSLCGPVEAPADSCAIPLLPDPAGLESAKLS